MFSLDGGAVDKSPPDATEVGDEHPVAAPLVIKMRLQVQACRHHRIATRRIVTEQSYHHILNENASIHQPDPSCRRN